MRRPWRHGGGELVITLQRGEALRPRQATWLRGVRHGGVLPLAFDRCGDAADAVLRYDVAGLASLRSRLRQLRDDDLVRLLVDLAAVLSWCAACDAGRLPVLCDVRHSFVDASGHLRLAPVPVDGVTYVAKRSPLALLGALADTRRPRCLSPTGVALAERVATHVLEAEGAFSLNAYRTFVAKECHVMIRTDGTVGTMGERRGANRSMPAVMMDGAVLSDASPTRLAVAPSPPGPHLVRVATGESFSLAVGRDACVGRGSACAVRVLGNPEISRSHACLRCERDGVVLRDLGSANGVSVDGASVQGCVRIGYGSRFRLAGEKFFVTRS